MLPLLLLRPRRLAAEGLEAAVREGDDESDVSVLWPGWTEASGFLDLNRRRSNMAAGRNEARVTGGEQGAAAEA